VKAALVEAVLNKAMPLAIASVSARALDESERIETDMVIPKATCSGLDEQLFS
jgi:hypothetical protein